MASLPSYLESYLEVIRPSDLQLLKFRFSGLMVNPPPSADPGQLVGVPNCPPLIVVEFPPQSIGEQSFFETPGFTPDPDPDAPSGAPADPTSNEDPPAGPVGSRLSGPSWLVFDVSGRLPIPYTAKGILDACRGAPILVSEHAGRPGEIGDLYLATTAMEAHNLFTVIEAPYRLQLSPAPNTRWYYALDPVGNKAGNRFELWHADMVGDTVRAVWSTELETWSTELPQHEDGKLANPFKPFRMSLDARDRYELIRLSTEVAPIPTQQLKLSSLGAWLKVDATWANPPDPLTITQWKHLMTMGRDHFVRVVYKGFLFPFGHEASLVKITERKFQTQPNGTRRFAYLRTRMFVIVRQPTVSYTHNGFPLTQITLKPLVTPYIDPPETQPIAGQGQDAFWIRVGGKDFQFHVAGLDQAGRAVEFTAPLAFVANSVATHVLAASVVNAFTALEESDVRRQRPLGGQPVAYAKENLSGDTTFTTDVLRLSAKYVVWMSSKNDLTGRPRFLPLIASADIDLPAVNQLLGTSQFTKVSYHETFCAATPGQFGNVAEVFLKMTGPNKLEAKFEGTRGGGLVRPDFTIEGISRQLGPVPKVEDMVAGVKDPVTGEIAPTFDPVKVFGDGIKLLGGLKLADIIKNPATFKYGLDAEGQKKVPTLLSFVEGQGDKAVAVARYYWRADKPLFTKNNALFTAGDGAVLEITSEVRRPLNGAAAAFLSRATLSDFSITLLPSLNLVKLTFSQVQFIAQDGKKPDVSVVFGGFQFLGQLRLVDQLLKYVPLDGFADPPSLDVDADGASLGYSLTLPPIGIGVFSLQNLAFSAEFRLPFTDESISVRLAFSSRENPAILTVTLFGGGAFFACRIDLAGVQEVEMALEFGGGVALNLGVASGSVTVMGGVYFQKSGKGFAVSAYVRLVGKLSVLGLISVSLEFYLGLTYLSGPNEDKLVGEATMKVKVKVLFFSKTVGLTVRREFKGSDPTFRQALTLPDWQAYCTAYGD